MLHVVGDLTVRFLALVVSSDFLSEQFFIGFGNRLLLINYVQRGSALVYIRSNKFSVVMSHTSFSFAE